MTNSSSAVTAWATIWPLGAMIIDCANESTPFLDATLGDAHHPGSVLVRAALHDERVVEALQDVLARIGHVVDRRVVAAEDHLDTLQAHHPVALRPAAVVADHHPHQTAERTPHAEAVGRWFEVVALGVLERAIGFVVLVPGNVRLGVAWRRSSRRARRASARSTGDRRRRATRSRCRSRCPAGGPRRTTVAWPRSASSARTSGRLRRCRRRTSAGRTSSAPARDRRPARHRAARPRAAASIIRCDHLLAAVVALHRPELRGGDGENSGHCRPPFYVRSAVVNKS